MVLNSKPELSKTACFFGEIQPAMIIKSKQVGNPAQNLSSTLSQASPKLDRASFRAARRKAKTDTL